MHGVRYFAIYVLYFIWKGELCQNIVTQKYQTAVFLFRNPIRDEILFTYKNPTSTKRCCATLCIGAKVSADTSNVQF